MSTARMSFNSAQQQQPHDRTSSIASAAGSNTSTTSTTSGSSLNNILSSADAVTLRKHLAETKEGYRDVVEKLRRQSIDRKAEQLELQLLRAAVGAATGTSTTGNSDSDNNNNNNNSNNIAVFNTEYQTLVRNHAHALEQREAHAEQIQSLKELLHSLTQDNKALRSQIAENGSGRIQRRKMQDLQEEVNKWEVLYYESAEMAVSQLQNVETKLEESLQREAKAETKIGELERALSVVAAETKTQQRRDDDDHHEDDHHEEQLMTRIAELELQLETETAQTIKRNDELSSSRIAALEQRITELEQERDTANTERDDARESLEQAQGRLAELEQERDTANTERNNAKEQLESIQLELKTLQVDYTTLEKERLEDHTASQSELCAFNDELEELTARLVETEAQLAESRRLSETIHSFNNNTNSQFVQDNIIQQLQSKLDTMTTENTKLRNVIRDSLQGFDKEITTVIQSLETELPIAQAEHDALKVELQEQSKRHEQALQEAQLREDFLVEQLSEQTHLLQESQSQYSRMEFLRQAVNDLKEDLEDAHETIYELQEENDHLLRERKSWWKSSGSSSSSSSSPQDDNATNTKRFSVEIGNILL